MPVCREGGLDVDAEFILLEAGGDMGVGLGVDIRVHPEGDPCPDAQPRRAVIDGLQLLDRFDVEHQDTGFERKIDLIPALSDPE